MSVQRALEVLPLVAVVGRPNVGKSSLVNRVVGRREAIVEEASGVTRDRKMLAAEWNGTAFRIADTGGWREEGDDLVRQVSGQAERAAREAELVLLVVDATVGVTDEDEAVAKLLRRARDRVVLVANKVDSATQETDVWQWYRLGLGEPWMVSALHGRGTGDLLDAVTTMLAAPQPEGLQPHGEATVPAVSVVGRPNVGKSTLFNRLIGDDRSITHELPGTTRDAVDTVVETEAGTFCFVDTAGMRRSSRVGAGTEYYSLVRALRAIDRGDVALLVIDATEGVTQQDQRLGERVDAAGSPVVVVLNKWECLGADRRRQVERDVEDRLAFLAYAPIVKVSARTGLGVHRVLPAVAQAVDAYHRRVPTSEVNRVLQAAQSSHPPSRGRVLYAVQGAADPPTFTLFTTRALPATYLRYLERRLREDLKLGPTAVKLRVRRRAGR